jgi:hypothetical protein
MEDWLYRQHMPWNDGVMRCWPALVRLSSELLDLLQYLNILAEQAFYEIGLGQGILGLAE